MELLLTIVSFISGFIASFYLIGAEIKTAYRTGYQTGKICGVMACVPKVLATSAKKLKKSKADGKISKQNGG